MAGIWKSKSTSSKYKNNEVGGERHIGVCEQLTQQRNGGHLESRQRKGFSVVTDETRSPVWGEGSF